MLRRQKHTDHALSLQLASLGFATTLLVSSPFGASAAPRTDAGQGSTPSKLERLFGVQPQDLVARPDADELLVSPVEEDSVSEMTVNAPRSTMRPDIHGCTSVENFQGTQGNLSYTHESAGGFCKFLAQWYRANFYYKDSAVSTWLFHDYNARGRNYDLWTSNGIDYGIDAVRTAFHSGHGGMDNNLFFVPMGANWDNTGWNAQSNLMALGGNHNRFGDERLRYVFWDTCNSVMISGGNNPYTTWGTRAKGIRFVFGYETTSVDSPNYGKFFWEEWSKGKTFKYAFLDASWRINTGQAPALVAFGATQSEAISRRDNERLLYANAVNNTWGAWSWYTARRTARASLADVLATISHVDPVEVTSRSNADQTVTEIAHAFGINIPDAQTILSPQAHLKVVQTNAMTLAVDKNGNFELFLTTPEEASEDEPVKSDTVLIRRAQRIARQLRFLKGQPLRVGMIRSLHENVGTESDQGEARVTEKTVILDQSIRGVPFIDPEAGHLEITFNARSGQITRVRNTLQAVQPVQSSQTRATAQVLTLEAARHAALVAFQQATGTNLRTATAAETVAESEAVGYQMMDGKAVLVYRAHITSAAVPGMRPFQAIIPLVQ